MRVLALRLSVSLFAIFLLASAFVAAPLYAQSGGSNGTIQGTVTDSTGGSITGAKIVLRNTISGLNRTATTGPDGTYQFPNIPFNPYHVTVSAPGFSTRELHVDIRSSVPNVLQTSLTIAAAGESVTVEAPGGDLIENSPTLHTDIDRDLFTKLPLESQSSSVSSLLTLASPGVAADSNGLFHGLGDHAENAFYVDGQPVTDQQSKVFSNQIPLSAIQSLEVISGAPSAEYGEKTSLVANITTRSGQGALVPRGEIVASYGSFGSSTISGDLAYGPKKFGNFLAADGLQTGRFLDPAEFSVMHDKGNVANFFDRVDFQPSQNDSLHVNGSYTRSWFQNPNAYENTNLTSQTGAAIPNTDQRSKIQTIDIAPSLTHVVNDHSDVSLGMWVRRDGYNYYPSRNPLSDFTPLQQETVSQARSLLNTGVRSDFNYVHGIHNIKVGGTYQQTLLNERFGLGIVDPGLNNPCTTAVSPSVNNPAQCVAAGSTPNPDFQAFLGCYDLTRNPSLADLCTPANVATDYIFTGHTDVKLLSMYGQDSITKGNFSVNLGLRGDFYNGLTTERQVEPRLGVSYNIKPSATVLRLSYARSLETPFNENLILSSKGCNSAVIAAIVPCVPASFNPGFRNEFHAGFEQTAGKHLVVTADYIWKYTHNGYDFSILGATPITFPIEWHNSKITGFVLRATVPQTHGFSGFVNMSSVAARFFPPQIGGLGTTETGGSPFRIDHDEKFNQTTHLQYQRTPASPFFSFNWRYDSGLVADGVPFAGPNDNGIVSLTGLSPDEQFQAGLVCAGVKATPTKGLPSSCLSTQLTSNLVSIPAAGTENDDHNPPRIKPRSLFDISLGQDNLFHGTKQKFSAQLTVINLTNKYALYNFLSTFSGTHYVTPRALTGEIGYHF